MTLLPLQDQLQQALGSAYRIERQVGAGGMATVFAAVETALERRVAVKVLRRELVAELSTERFARAVRLAASLQQANIVPLLAAGTAGEFSYYTMPLIDGSSLRARMATGESISMTAATSILRDVARALAYAHGAGVVHRDIKPDNVLLSGGTAVVSDFGIAKAMDAARTGNSSTMTSPGLALGSPGYMAPEQIAGDHVDHRADIYAWGVVAWELLASRHPFDDQSSQQAMLAAQLTTEAPPLEAQNPAVPPRLSMLVAACLAKDPDRRPQSATELLDVLDSITTPTDIFAAPRRKAAKRSRAMIAVGVAAAALLGWGAVTRFGKQAADPRASTSDDRLSVAVLPFDNIGGDTAQQYFTDGLTDELATALGRIPGVRVASRSATYQYREQRGIDVRQVGSALGVRYLLLGSVRRSGNQLRLSAQLAGTDDALEVWSDAYSRPADDVLSVQDSLTAAIANALSGLLGTRSVADTEITMAQRRGTSNREAYDLYLKGQYYLTRRRPGLEGAVRSFEAAIAADNQFARAYAGLANALALLTYFGEQPLDEQRVLDVAHRALAIDSAQADAYVALGILHMSVGRLAVAEDELRSAIALEPANAAAHFQLGRVHTYQGRLEEAAQELERSKSIERFMPATATWLGYVLTNLGQVDRGTAEARRAWELDSSAAVVQLFNALTAFESRRTADAQRIIHNSPNRNVLTRGAFALILGRIESRDSARAHIDAIQARGARLWCDYANMTFAALGAQDTALALASVERSLARNEPFAGYLPLWSRVFDEVREDPRFARMTTESGIRIPPSRAR
ncbi:MAG TPA: protein kinase [Gemmatimonadales bacterium]|nr:protein kinase [Gemmatimonadales bacterium]